MAESSAVFEGGTHFLQPRSHSLCSNLLFSTSSAANGISGQSLSTIPGASAFQQEHNQQQTLVGAETFDGQFLGGQSARLANSGGNGSGGVNFGRRVSRQDPQRWHLSNSWLERVFQRRECIKFIPCDAHSDRCHCGRVSALHSQLALSRFTSFCFSFLSLFLALLHVLNWLDFINYLAYTKMAVTLSKYFPQAILNFRRKSTVGWSIGNVLLDFFGGSMDICQMILQASNTDDWSAFTGNPVKFGLGLISIIFDVLFMLQHYLLYPHKALSTYDQVSDERASSPPTRTIALDHRHADESEPVVFP